MKITSSEFLLSSGTKTLRVPLDHLQQFRFHFYKSEFQSVSLAYLYALDKKWKKDQLTSPQIKASAQRQFKDKILIIGSSASELQDIKSTPISRAYPGALLHATAISNILEGHYLKDLPEQSALLVSVLIVAFIYLLIFYAKNLFLKTLFPLIFLALFTVSCLYLFQVESINIPMASPILFGLLGYFDGIFKST